MISWLLKRVVSDRQMLVGSRAVLERVVGGSLGESKGFSTAVVAGKWKDIGLGVRELFSDVSRSGCFPKGQEQRALYTGLVKKMHTTASWNMPRTLVDRKSVV